ncbi:hypothetical protein ACFRCX_02535 [Streptomyces sp. NPDC056652]|uniref:hypothetical protein n=1 Tax=Streptomyces sp. NPDC056652 TaxID=3345893 RepID=UPI0036C74D16
MTESPTGQSTVPGAGFVAGCVVSTWLDVTPAGPVAWLLLGHPPPRRPGETAGNVEAGLRSVAAAMGLRRAVGTVPYVGERLLIRGPITALDYGHHDCLLRLPDPGPRWRAHLTGGGLACITLGLDSMPLGASRDAIGMYIRRSASAGRALVGATGVRTR